MTHELWASLGAAIIGLIGALTIYIKARSSSSTKPEAPTGILEFRLAPKEIELAKEFVAALNRISDVLGPELKKSAEAQERIANRRDEAIMSALSDLQKRVGVNETRK